VRLAYIISAYRNLGQTARLVRRLERSDAVFLVHVDKKTDAYEYAALEASLEGLPSVRFLDRHTCHWGGFGHVRATLKGIDELLGSSVPFDYAILLTGQDYPIKPNDYIDGFFERHRPQSFMLSEPLPSASWSPRGGLDRIEHWHLRAYGHHLRWPFKRTFPAGLRPCGGGAYWSLSRECIEHVARFVAERPDVVSFFKHVDIPDEIFFQTILMNSELRESIVSDNLRYIDWTRGRRPAILETRDFEALRASPKLFARKFDVDQDEEVLDLIDRHLLQLDAEPADGSVVAPTT
jgi:core-2/I-Branching enzyme